MFKIARDKPYTHGKMKVEGRKKLRRVLQAFEERVDGHEVNGKHPFFRHSAQNTRWIGGIQEGPWQFWGSNRSGLRIKCVTVDVISQDPCLQLLASDDFLVVFFCFSKPGSPKSTRYGYFQGKLGITSALGLWERVSFPRFVFWLIGRRFRRIWTRVNVNSLSADAE